MISVLLWALCLMLRFGSPKVLSFLAQFLSETGIDGHEVSTIAQ